MRWLCLALLAGVLVCGCGPVAEQASAAAGPAAETGPPALAGPSAVGRYVGRVVVSQVFPDYCAARYSKPDMRGDVEVGDDVTTKLVVDF